MSLAICLNPPVTTAQANWLANLKALVDDNSESDDKRPGYRFVATAAGLSEEYIYQLYNGKKADGTPPVVGTRAARQIARAFANGRPLNWIDAPPNQPSAPTPQEAAPRFDLVSAVEPLAGLLLVASPMARKASAPVLAGIAEAPELWHEAAEMLAKLLGPGASGGQAGAAAEGSAMPDNMTTPALIARLIRTISTTPEHLRRQAVINADAEVWRVRRTRTPEATMTTERLATSSQPIEGHQSGKKTPPR